jgi:hypothetical protein
VRLRSEEREEIEQELDELEIEFQQCAEEPGDEPDQRSTRKAVVTLVPDETALRNAYLNRLGEQASRISLGGQRFPSWEGNFRLRRENTYLC